MLLCNEWKEASHRKRITSMTIEWFFFVFIFNCINTIIIIIVIKKSFIKRQLCNDNDHHRIAAGKLQVFFFNTLFGLFTHFKFTVCYVGIFISHTIFLCNNSSLVYQIRKTVTIATGRWIDVAIDCYHTKTERMRIRKCRWFWEIITFKMYRMKNIHKTHFVFTLSRKAIAKVHGERQSS